MKRIDSYLWKKEAYTAALSSIVITGSFLFTDSPLVTGHIVIGMILGAGWAIDKGRYPGVMASCAIIMATFWPTLLIGLVQEEVIQRG